jgi:hypothetical protein
MTATAARPTFLPVMSVPPGSSLSDYYNFLPLRRQRISPRRSCFSAARNLDYFALATNKIVVIIPAVISPGGSL